MVLKEQELKPSQQVEHLDLGLDLDQHEHLDLDLEAAGRERAEQQEQEQGKAVNMAREEQELKPKSLEPPTQRNSICVVRGREQGKRVTDLIRGFNAMNKVVVEQTMVKKRKASEMVEQIEATVGGKSEKRRKSRTSSKHGSSRSEKEISIRNYFKTNTTIIRGSPVGEHRGQEQVPEQGVAGGVGGNPVQEE